MTPLTRNHPVWIVWQNDTAAQGGWVPIAVFDDHLVAVECVRRTMEREPRFECRYTQHTAELPYTDPLAYRARGIAAEAAYTGATTMAQPTCATCRFFVSPFVEDYPERGLTIDKRRGTCRAHAPVLTPRKWSEWPVVADVDFCGDHEPRKETTT